MQTLSPNEPTPANANSEPVLVEGLKIGGCYVLRRQLSGPGARPVWVASDEVLGKDVTLHFVPAAVAADARAMTELRQEVKRNRQLIHPNILRVYDFVEDGSHVAISMDEFEGESLHDVLQKKGTLDPADLKPWITQLAETLADAHRIQLFHRDLAPENIYLRPNGGLLVANFGISRVILNSLERAGIAKGAEAHLAYLSPQQIDGDRPSASDDIYGLGVLMNTLLAGSPPFSGDDIMPQIRKNVPPAISALRAAAGAAAPVSASWEKLIATSLEKNPEARPRNLTDVLTLLGQDSGPARVQSAPGAAAAAAVVAVEKATAGIAAQNLTGLDAPLKTQNHHEGHGHETAAGKLGESVPAAETAAASDKPLHPEIPPITQRPPARKAPAKGALSANFPDLDRPRSKAPLVWLLLAAGIIGGGIYLRNKPEAPDVDENGGVTRIDDANPDGGTLPPNFPKAAGSTPPSSKSPESLPDPEPVTPKKTVARVIIPEAPKTAATGVTGQPPKIIATPAPKPPKAGLIGGESEPAVKAPPQPGDVVPNSLAGASAQTAGKPTPDAKGATPGNTQTKAPELIGGHTPINVGVSTPITASTPPEKTPAPPVKPEATPQPAATAKKVVPLPLLPDPIQPLQKLALPEKPTVAQLEEIKQQREATIKSIRSSGAIADAAHMEASRRLDTAKAEKEKRQKELDSKRKILAPVIQQAEALAAERKKYEDEAAKALAAAAEATRQAEAAKRKIEETVAKGSEKLQARQQAEGELNALTAEFSATAQEVDEISQVVTKAEAIRMQARLSQQQAELDLQKIATATDKAQRAEKEMHRKANVEKIAGIEKQISDLKAQASKFDATIEPLKELGDAGKEAIKKIEEKKAAAQKQIGDLQNEIKRISSGAADALPPKETGAVVTPPTPVIPVVAETPEKAPVTTAETGAVANSLGMKFVPVGDVQFSVYLTTVKDFEAFANATGLKSEAWKNPGFKQGSEHPVVNVTWREGEAFCKWLTDKERKSGQLKAGEAYRLPTDLEWSKAVGLPPESGATPEERDMGVQDVYPWGNQWPPPAGAGNYAGEETQTEIPIPNYNDGYPNTSPVGKFKPNAAGLYDMGGNVWQWVGDSWNGENRAKTLRGGSWYNGAIPLSLLSSCRISSSPDTLHDTYGFRIVKAVAKAAEGAKPHRRN